MKNSVLDNFPLCPPAHPPPLKNANFIFIVVSLSLIERVDLRSQKDRILGKKIAWGRVGWTGQKKEQRMCKNSWVLVILCRGGDLIWQGAAPLISHAFLLAQAPH